MTDTVIKGSGNSRSLKTVPNALTLYPTHEALVAAMVDGTFPIDLGPLNDAGVQTRGMDLNKANLLSDATAALYGKGDNASPDEVLAAIAPYLSKIGEKAQIEVGSYVGTGPGGINNPNSISFSFPVKIAAVVTMINPSGPQSLIYREKDNIWLLVGDTLSFDWVETYGFGIVSSGPKYPFGKISSDRKTIYWYHPSGANNHGYQFNTAGYTYYYFAIG